MLLMHNRPNFAFVQEPLQGQTGDPQNRVRGLVAIRMLVHELNPERCPAPLNNVFFVQLRITGVIDDVVPYMDDIPWCCACSFETLSDVLVRSFHLFDPWRLVIACHSGQRDEFGCWEYGCDRDMLVGWWRLVDAWWVEGAGLVVV